MISIPGFLAEGDTVFADTVIADNYIQHNPMVKTGKSGFIEFMAFLKQIPIPDNTVQPFKRLITDNNFVAVHSQIEFMGKENATIDLFRIENGLIKEHWDAVQVIEDSKPVVRGTTELDNGESTEKNKQIIEEFITQVLVNNQFEKSNKYLSKDLNLNNFEITNDSFNLCRMIGENNFVLTQAEVIITDVRYVVYSIYRLSNGRIVEYWSVRQVVPKQMAHSNGMI